jgi:hypothetical protein
MSPPRGDYKTETVDELANIPMVEIHPVGDPLTMLDWTGMLRRACSVRVMIRKDGTINHCNNFPVEKLYSKEYGNEPDVSMFLHTVSC